MLAGGRRYDWPTCARCWSRPRLCHRRSGGNCRANGRGCRTRAVEQVRRRSQGGLSRSLDPHIFCIRPNDYMWQWPATFIESYPSRLRELGRIDEEFEKSLRAELADAEKSPNSLMLTPLVLEIIAEKL